MGLSAQPGPACICFGAVTHMHCLTAAGVHSISALSLPLSQQAGHGGPGILQVGGVGLLHTHPGAQCMRLPIGVSSCPCIESALGHRQAGDLSGRLLYCCMCPPSNGVWLTPAGAKVADALRRSLCRPCNAGRRCELSERPLLCASVSWAAGEAVIGGSDHALYTVDLQTGKKRRTLYTKTCGHAE